MILSPLGGIEQAANELRRSLKNQHSGVARGTLRPGTRNFLVPPVNKLKLKIGGKASKEAKAGHFPALQLFCSFLCKKTHYALETNSKKL